MQLTRVVVCLLVVSAAAGARADELVIRGNYWRDRNTRILQPEVDVLKETRTGTIVGAHYLLDTITSASVAAGAVRDHPFTELRHEVGARLGQRVGPATISASYSYSSESDYWAHFVKLGVVAELFGKMTTLATSLSYGHDTVALRQGPTVYVELGKLDAVGWNLGVTQVLTRTLTLTVGYELLVSGFGKQSNGFQSNAYRPANVGGSPLREQTPYQRFRHSIAASVNWIVPLGGVVPWIAFRPSLRAYVDDWEVVSVTPELRTFLPVGPIEFRLTGRYYRQSAASFFREQNGVPFYTAGVKCTSCTSATVRAGEYFTSDPKLSRFDSMFVELRLLLKLSFLARLPKFPMARFLSAGIVEVSYGHYFTSALQRRTFGDAEVAGLTFTFPL